MSGLGRAGTGTLKVDGKVVATQKMEKTLPMILQWDESFDIGSDTLTGVNDADYQPPFTFTGKLNKLTIKVDRPQLSPEDIKKLELRHAITKRVSNRRVARIGDSVRTRGATIDEFQEWKPGVRNHEISLEGTLTSSGLLRLVVFLEHDSSQIHGDSEKLAGGSQSPNPMADDVKVPYATKQYYDGVGRYLRDLSHRPRLSYAWLVGSHDGCGQEAYAGSKTIHLGRQPFPIRVDLTSDCRSRVVGVKNGESAPAEPESASRPTGQASRRSAAYDSRTQH